MIIVQMGWSYNVTTEDVMEGVLVYLATVVVGLAIGMTFGLVVMWVIANLVCGL